MKLALHRRPRGIALIIVLVVILSLTVLVGGFVYSMKVEVKLARNRSVEAEMEWLGRSGVERAKWALALQLKDNSQPYDSLNQKWAGGPGGIITNNLLEDYSLEPLQLGDGTVGKLQIIDLERRFNINTAAANPLILQQALRVMGVDPLTAPEISDSIADWIDRDDQPRLTGAESKDYYLNQKPSYFAKNGPIDDMSELLLIRGITPGLLWGSKAGENRSPGLFAVRAQTPVEEVAYPVGLMDLFTALSQRYINLNTAPAEVLQLVPGIDANIAQSIIRFRSGPDGAEGTGDDTPFRNPGELVGVPGMNYQIVGQFQQLGVLFIRSSTFEVTVPVDMAGVHREYVAVLRRNNPNDIQVLTFYSK